MPENGRKTAHAGRSIERKLPRYESDSEFRYSKNVGSISCN